MRILIVRTSSVGDVLHTLPMLTDATQVIPGVRLDWVVEGGLAQIPSWHEGVERVIPVTIHRWCKTWLSAPIRAERQAFREAAQAVKYDVVIDAQGLVKSAVLVTRLAHGVRHGMDWRTVRKPLVSLLYNHRHHITEQQHVVGRTRELFAKNLGHAKSQTRGDHVIARHLLQHEASAAAPYLVFLHTTTRDSKHWSGTHWQELLDLLAGSGIRIRLPWNTSYGEAQAKRLTEDRECVKVLPRMNLERMMQVLVGARAVVSVDTGLSHLTAALDEPSFTLYGPTDSGLIGGHGKDQHIVRSENNISISDILASRAHLLLQNQGLL